MIGKFGVSASICVGDVKKLAGRLDRLSAREFIEGYLSLLEDSAAFIAEQGFTTIEIEFGFSLINVDKLTPSLKTLKEIEIEAIKKALLENHGNKTDAARDLGIARGTLYRKMKIFGIATNDEVA